jgi:hypothetical protein
MKLETRTKSSFEIFYDKLNYITSLVESESHVQDALDSLEGQEQRDFEDLIVRFLDISDEIKEAEEKNEYYLEVNHLFELINQVMDLKPDFFGSFKFYKEVYLLILKKLTDIDEPDFAELNCNMDFKLYEVDIQEEKFFFSGQSMEESILLISLVDLEDTNEVLSLVNIDMLFTFLEALSFTEAPEVNKLCLINTLNPLFTEGVLNKEKLEAVINLKKVSKGNIIHKDFQYTQAPSIPISLNWALENEYQQFKDVVYILSEYNEQKNILERYIK